ncbi:MAG: HIT domain-containing protein [Nanoarchaeota archaeon]|nr:HIT domain-containing protein [Nanoarchaeota archaeon]
MQQQMSEQDMAALQEKIKNMSPEELQAYQKQNCIFCQIISGKIPGKKVYEDDKVLAILDINPAGKGHILLMPKEHYAIMPIVPQEVLGHMFIIAKKLSNAVLKKLKATGTTIFIANGGVAGQRAQHFMIHIIPRYEGDEIEALEFNTKKLKKQDIESIKEKLTAKIGYKPGNAEIEAKVEEKTESVKKEIKKEKKSSKKTVKKKVKKKVSKKSKKEEPSEEELDKKIEESEGIDLDAIANLLG